MAWDDSKIALFSTCFCIVLITSCGLFGGSFDVIRPNHVGFVYNMNTEHIDFGSKLRHSGRYLVGLGKRYITFPTTYESIRLGSTFSNRDADDVLCRSRDGLVFNIEVSFQYQVSQVKDDLVRLYLDFGKKHQAVYTKIAQASLRDVCSRYMATEFISERGALAEDLESELDQRLRRVYASVLSLELVNMEFKIEFQRQIERTQVAKQDVILADFELRVAEVEADKNIITAQTLATLLVSQANATASALIDRANADAAALVNRIRAQVDAFLELKTSLNLQTSQEILAYHWFSVLEELPSTHLTIGLDYPELLRAMAKGNSTT